MPRRPRYPSPRGELDPNRKLVEHNIHQVFRSAVECFPNWTNQTLEMNNSCVKCEQFRWSSAEITPPLRFLHTADRKLWQRARRTGRMSGGGVTRLRYLLKAWSSWWTTEDSWFRQATASCGGGGPPTGRALCMVWGSKPRALNTSKLEQESGKWPQGSMEQKTTWSFM